MSISGQKEKGSVRSSYGNENKKIVGRTYHSRKGIANCNGGRESWSWLTWRFLKPQKLGTGMLRIDHAHSKLAPSALSHRTDWNSADTKCGAHAPWAWLISIYYRCWFGLVGGLEYGILGSHCLTLTRSTLMVRVFDDSHDHHLSRPSPYQSPSLTHEELRLLPYAKITIHAQAKVKAILGFLFFLSFLSLTVDWPPPPRPSPYQSPSLTHEELRLLPYAKITIHAHH